MFWEHRFESTTGGQNRRHFKETICWCSWYVLCIGYRWRDQRSALSYSCALRMVAWFAVFVSTDFMEPVFSSFPSPPDLGRSPSNGNPNQQKGLDDEPLDQTWSLTRWPHCFSDLDVFSSPKLVQPNKHGLVEACFTKIWFPSRLRFGVILLLRGLGFSLVIVVATDLQVAQTTLASGIRGGVFLLKFSPVFFVFFFSGEIWSWFPTLGICTNWLLGWFFVSYFFRLKRKFPRHHRAVLHLPGTVCALEKSLGQSGRFDLELFAAAPHQPITAGERRRFKCRESLAVAYFSKQFAI